MKITDLKSPHFDPQQKGDSKISWVPRKVRVVSGGNRLLHFLLDLVLYGFLLYLFQYLFFHLFYQVPLEYWEGMNMMAQLIPASALFLYYSLSEILFQQSPGKMIFGHYVVDEFGQKPDPWRVLVRNLCRFIPFEALSCLDKRGWHDKLSRTFVVDREELEELRRLLKEQSEDATIQALIIN